MEQPKHKEFKPSIQRIKEEIGKNDFANMKLEDMIKKSAIFRPDHKSKPEHYNQMTQIIVPIMIKTPIGNHLTHSIGFVPQNTIIFP